MFLSSDALVCRAAGDLELPFLTLPDVLAAWADQQKPALSDLEAMIDGMRAARFGPRQDFADELRRPAGH